MVTKAIIPIAGEGTRLRPQTYACPKPFLPLVDARGQIRPVIHWIVAEAVAAGIDEIALVVSPNQLDMTRGYFDAVSGTEGLPGHIEYLIQQEPRGFGHAVALGEDFAAGEPFLLMLGDHVHIPGLSGSNGAKQVSAAFDTTGGVAVTGMHVVSEKMLHLVGVAAGEPVDGSIQGLYRCREFIEKPDISSAREKLCTVGLEDGSYLAHSGIYIFSPVIFGCLLNVRENNSGGEIELSAAQTQLLHEHRDDYYLLSVDARTLDVGTPEGYAEAFRVFRGDRSDG